MVIYAALAMSVLLLALAPVASGIDYTTKDLASEEAMRDLYKRWCTHYPMGRGCDLDNNDYRFKIFKEHATRINNLNKGVVHNRRRLNQFSDQTHEEYVKSYASCYTNGREHQNEVEIIPNDKFAFANNIPSHIDWRQQGAVTDVRDQGKCGCCWAFAAAGAVESSNKIKNNELLPLSVQELLDCSTTNEGCKGGTAARAFDDIINGDGISKWEDNPYLGWEGTVWNCHDTKKIVVIGGYNNVPRYNETTLMQAVASQPVVVSIDSSSPEFHEYPKGVFTGPCGTKPNHQVLLVGYGTAVEFDERTMRPKAFKYWLIKNSWGDRWGEGGYMRLERGRGDEEIGGLCGILKDALYPVDPVMLEY